MESVSGEAPPAATPSPSLVVDDGGASTEVPKLSIKPAPIAVIGKDGKTKKRKRDKEKQKKKKDKSDKKTKKEKKAKKDSKKSKKHSKHKRSKEKKAAKRKRSSDSAKPVKKGRVKQTVLVEQSESEEEEIMEYSEEQKQQVETLKKMREILWGDEKPEDKAKAIKELDGELKVFAEESLDELKDLVDSIGGRVVIIRLKTTMDKIESQGVAKVIKKKSKKLKLVPASSEPLTSKARSSRKRKAETAALSFDSARTKMKEAKLLAKKKQQEHRRELREKEREERKAKKDEEAKKKREEREKEREDKRRKKLGLPSAKIEDLQLTDSVLLPDPGYGYEHLGIDSDLFREAVYCYNFLWTFAQPLQLTRFTFPIFLEGLGNLHETTLAYEVFKCLQTVCQKDETGRPQRASATKNWLTELMAWIHQEASDNDASSKTTPRGKSTGKAKSKTASTKTTKKKPVNKKTARFQCDDSESSEEDEDSDDDEEEEEEEKEEPKEEATDEQQQAVASSESPVIGTHPWTEVPFTKIKTLAVYSGNLGRANSLPNYGIEDRLILLRHLIHCALRTDTIRQHISEVPGQLQDQSKQYNAAKNELLKEEKNAVANIEEKYKEGGKDNKAKEQQEKGGDETGKPEAAENEGDKTTETTDNVEEQKSPVPKGRPKPKPKLSAEEKSKKAKLKEEKTEKLNQIRANFKQKLEELTFDYHLQMESRTFRTAKPLGEDRYRRLYWRMPNNTNIYVQRTHKTLTDKLPTTTTDTNVKEKTPQKTKDTAARSSSSDSQRHQPQAVGDDSEDKPENEEANQEGQEKEENTATSPQGDTTNQSPVTSPQDDVTQQSTTENSETTTANKDETTAANKDETATTNKDENTTANKDENNAANKDDNTTTQLESNNDTTTDENTKTAETDTDKEPDTPSTRDFEAEAEMQPRRSTRNLGKVKSPPPTPTKPSTPNKTKSGRAVPQIQQKEDESESDDDKAMDCTWGIFTSTTELISCLNDRGIRESTLKRNLESLTWIETMIANKTAMQVHNTRASKPRVMKDYKNKFKILGAKDQLEW